MVGSSGVCTLIRSRDWYWQILDHLGLRGLRRYLRYHTWAMETQHPFPAQRTGALVCRVYDSIVRFPPVARWLYSCYIASLSPGLLFERFLWKLRLWVVPCFLLEIYSHMLIAIAQSCRSPFRPWDAARSLGQNQPHLGHGVPRLWNHQWGAEISISLYDMRCSRWLYEESCCRSTQISVD